LLEESAASTNLAWIQVTAAANLPRGAYEISVKNTNAESGKFKLYVDDLPQAYEADLKKTPTGSPSLSHPMGEGQGEGSPHSPNPETPVLKLPVSFWGALDPAGDTDEIEFEVKTGDSVILDLAAKSLGSKAS